jgi:predicted transcriptional regulator
MSLAPNRPLTEITETAFRLLIQEMGVVNTTRFINQFSTGYGDSVAEKERIFGNMTVDEIAAAIQQRKQQMKSQ